jgi:hypothetical protein
MAKPTTAKKTKPLSKSEALNAVAEAVGDEVSRKQVKRVVETRAHAGSRSSCSH